MDLRTIVTAPNLNQTGTGGGGGLTGATGAGAVGTTLNYTTDIQPFGPTPFTFFRSSALAKGRPATMRPARTGPTPGNLSSSVSLAVFTSSLPVVAGGVDAG